MGLYLVFVLVLVLAAAAVILFIRAGQREREEEVLLRLRATGGDEAKAYGMQVGRGHVRNPVLRAACHLVWRTGSDMAPQTIAKVLWVVLALVPAAIVIFGWLVGVAVVATLLALGWAYLSRQAARRRAQIVEQMPAFLENAIRVLSAGNTLDEALAVAARESPDPIRPLFVSVGRQVRLGAPVESVLMETAEIHQLREIQVMALAAAINRKYGGSLRNVLRSLIQAIRSRDTAARELRALTAETRFSAIVLSIIPIVLMIYIYIQNPGYYATMWLNPVGRGLLVGSILMQVCGVLVIYRMMRSTEEPV